MNVKTPLLIAGYLLVLTGVYSCKEVVNEDPPVIRPVITTIVGGVDDLTKSTFPAITREVQSVNLAFRVSGPLIKLNATQGQAVQKGQLIAEIDPRDFQVDLLAKEARFIQARAELERFQTTYDRGAISKSEYDQKLALFLESKSSYEAAKNALEDTKLRSPFDAYIDQKLVENHERVQTGETIVTLLDPSDIEVRFSIPESIAIHFREFENFQVTFDVFQDTPFVAHLKEIGKRSERSAGVPVILVLEDKNTSSMRGKIIPGMACKVKVNMKNVARSEEQKDSEFTIPLSAVYAQPDSDQIYVYLLDNNDMKVKKTEVTLGSMVSSNLIWAIHGLKKGDILVTAGARILQDGQSVKLLK